MTIDIIKKVCVNTSSGQKFVTIPRASNIKPGDYVKIIKMESE